ncbi:MAG: glycogen synthase [Chloroflexota bacterium]|nr:glycogen synthase [Chloroflexota bacterium]MDE3193994.1 glycogen synthase [Chloroflexota bacterium]
MRIVFAAAEVAPYAKVGGLADVAGSLPQALAALGHHVSIHLPLHGTIDRERFGIPTDAVVRSVPYGRSHVRVAYPSIVRGGVRVVFVDNGRHIGRATVYGAPDDAKRYALFARAVAEDLAQGGDRPDVIHAHDWHTALLVPMAAGHYRRALGGPATVFTIHNLAYQGQSAVDVVGLVGLPRKHVHPEKHGELNPMARAIASADAVSTVSERYAEEILTPEFGNGLEALLAERRDDLWGIVNGIDVDVFDPFADAHIPVHYSAVDMRGKAQDKAALQKELGLAVSARTPLFGVIGRLVEQKGIDILTPVAPEILRAGGQIAVLGTGEPRYEAMWKELAERHAGSLSLRLGFDAALAQRIYAGSDMFLMPSRFEPCGLGQLISFRYGTVPVVRAVGGLADTVRDADADARQGTGFSFREYAAEPLGDAVRRAIRAYRDGARWSALRTRVMGLDHSWAASARRYVEMYEAARDSARAA